MSCDFVIWTMFSLPSSNHWAPILPKKPGKEGCAGKFRHLGRFFGVPPFFRWAMTLVALAHLCAECPSANRSARSNAGWKPEGIDDGSLFRRVDRHGRVSAEQLSAEAVCLAVRGRIATAGYDPRSYSGHSLRSGFATSAAQAGVSTLKIRGQTGHASDAMLARYPRDGELFIDNSAGMLL